MLAALAILVGISIEQSGGLTTLQRDMVITELREIWRPAGVRMVARNSGEPLAPGEAVVSMRILASKPMQNRRGEPILAWVAVDGNRRPTPSVLVSLPTIIQWLERADVGGKAFNHLTNDLRARLIATAIGRVAAHELGHYLMADAPHRRKGLMRPAYSPRDLAGSWRGPFELAPEDGPVIAMQVAALAEMQHISHP